MKRLSAPINMVLHCPKCRAQHIDAPEWRPKDCADGVNVLGWTNPPHHSHLCHHCGTIWRPADVPTNGVTHAMTRGEKDTWP